MLAIAMLAIAMLAIAMLAIAMSVPSIVTGCANGPNDSIAQASIAKASRPRGGRDRARKMRRIPVSIMLLRVILNRS
jgi:hypothetical protein